MNNEKSKNDHGEHGEHGEHGHGHDKTVTIVVNGRKKEVRAHRLSYTEIVALAFPNPQTGPNIVYTVTYRGGERPKPEGTLSEGDIIKIKDGMIFNVTKTDKS